MRLELTGQHFGRLIVLQYAYTMGKRQYWHCGCTCGSITTIMGTRLKRRHTQSCGCLKRERIRTYAGTHSRHGHTSRSKGPTKTYKCWQEIRQRCHNPDKLGYHNYGGRGIQVCQRWRDAFENFHTDMGDKPPGMTIERIDNNKDYSPENCRWASMLEQGQNRRTNKPITFRGKTQTISAWARELGISSITLRNRLKREWTPERALTEPIQYKKV